MPIVCGILNGIYFGFWMPQQVEINVKAFLDDVGDFSNDWGAPEFTFRDFQNTRNDFHVRRLNPNDWTGRLGFSHPAQYVPFSLSQDPAIGIDKYGDLTTLMLDTKTTCGVPPKEQWVYISGFAWPLFNEWDAAFDAAVQAGYVATSLNATRIFYVTCSGTGKFLCGVWGVRPPALLHFLIEDSPPQPEDINSDLNYSGEPLDLRPVTVRVIEFPLRDEYTALPSSVFPGPVEQVLAIMRGDRLWEQFEPWSETRQALLRFQEFIDVFYLQKGHFLYYIGEADEWMVEQILRPIALEDAGQILYEITFMLTSSVVSLILKPYYLVRELVLEFLGYPVWGDQVPEGGQTKAWNPWDNLLAVSSSMSQLLENVLEEAEVKQAKKDYSDSGTTTSLKPRNTLIKT